LTVRCFRRPVLCAATSSCGRTGCRAGWDLPRLGVRQPMPSPPPWAEPPWPVCRSLDGHVRWSLCRWTPTGPPAALRIAGVRDPCRIAGRCPNPCRTTAICNGCAWADASAVVSGSRLSRPVSGHPRRARFPLGGRAVRSLSTRRGHLADCCPHRSPFGEHRASRRRRPGGSACLAPRDPAPMGCCSPAHGDSAPGRARHGRPPPDPRPS
jgi:hypothetical protein